MATVTIATRSLKKGKAYVIHVKDPKTGKKKYHKTYRRKDLAQEEVNRIRTLIDSGKMPTKEAKQPKPQSLPTFGQAAKLCQAEWDRKLGEDKLKPKTHAGYGHLLGPILKDWKHTLLHDISEEVIRDYRIGIAKKTKTRLIAKDKDGKNCNVLANRRLFVIKQVFAQAKHYGMIDKNVAKNIPILTEKGSERKVAQTPMEVDALLEAAYQRRSKHYLPLAILLTVEHGCSKQEVLSLKWADISLTENHISFYREKNEVPRTHQIMPRTKQALIARRKHLDQYRAKRNIKVKDDYVIGSMNGTPFGDIKTAWNNLCKEHDFEDLRFHDHRHTYATNLLLSGCTLKEVSGMIGHKTLRMTNRYCNLEGVTDNKAQERLAERYAMASNDE